MYTCTHLRSCLAVLGIVLSYSAVWGAPPSAYSVRVLGPLGGPALSISGLGEDGSVAGSAEGRAILIAPDGTRTVLSGESPYTFTSANVITPTRIYGTGITRVGYDYVHALWQWTRRTGFQDITGGPVLDALITDALPNGVWVGHARRASTGIRGALIGYGGATWYLPGLAGPYSLAEGINAYQVVIGTSEADPTCLMSPCRLHATFWWLGRPYDLDPGRGGSLGIAINNHNHMLILSDGVHLWTPERGHGTPLPDALPGQSWANPQALNDHDTVVGSVATHDAFALSGYASHGWRYTPARGSEVLTDLIAAPGWDITDALAVNNREQILAHGTYAGADYALVLTPITPGNTLAQKE